MKTYDLADVIAVVPWDEVSGHPAYDPRDSYVEHYWLPVIGPTCTLLLRRCAEVFESYFTGFDMNCVEMSRAMGLGNPGRWAPFARAVHRLDLFGFAQPLGSVGTVDRLRVRRTVPVLSSRQVASLPITLRDAYQSKAWGAP